jgi:hypothetical protein
MSDDPWTQHEIDQIRRSASLTPKQRLDWLCQAKVFAHKAMLAAEERRAQAAAASVEAAAEAIDASTSNDQGDGRTDE